MGLVESVRTTIATRPAAEREIATIDDYAIAMAQYLQGGGFGGVQQTQNGQPSERITNSFVGYASGGYAGNAIVFSCMAVRQLVFSAVRIRYQNMSSGRPGDLFGNASLAVVEKPWQGGTTQDLLSRQIQDADLAGNAYWTRLGSEMVRLRPDYVDIILEPRRYRGGQLGWKRLGYLYTEGGLGNGGDSVPLLLDEVAHFAPLPDPLATYRGMSWLTPVIREIQNDGAMSDHKNRFMENAATPNLVIRYDPTFTPENFKKFKKIIDEEHTGPENAYKTMHLGGGADVSVVGANMQQLDFKQVQGAGETRIAAAAGVHPVIVGLSEGLQGSSLNAGNYGQARRRFADATMHPLWTNAAGSLAPLLQVPADARCWYDATGVPFLREDKKDAAEILFVKAQTIRQLVDAGYEPASVVLAVELEDMRLLQHSGLYSVQLQAPITAAALTAGQSNGETQ